MTAIYKALLEETVETPEINNWEAVGGYHLVDDHADESFAHAYLPRHPAIYHYEIFVALKDGLWRARFNHGETLPNNHGETLPKVTFTDHDNPRDATLEAEEQVAEYYAHYFCRSHLTANIENNMKGIEKLAQEISHAHHEIVNSPHFSSQLEIDTYGHCIPLWLKELQSRAREMYLSTRFVYVGYPEKGKLLERLRDDIEAPEGDEE
jgi:hypothetical protein